MKHHAHIRHNLVCIRYYPKDNNLSSLKSVLGPPALCDVKSCASVNCSLYISEKVRSEKRFSYSSRATKQLLLNLNELHMCIYSWK